MLKKILVEKKRRAKASVLVIFLVGLQAAQCDETVLKKCSPLALRNGAHYRCEVIVGEDYVGGLLGDVGATLAHRDANVGGLAI